MATHALSESRPSCLRTRQRILCLHSFRTSGAILKQQLFLFSNLGTISSAGSWPQAAISSLASPLPKAPAAAEGSGVAALERLGRAPFARPSLATLPSSCSQAPPSPTTAISTTSTRRIDAARPTTRSRTRSSRRSSRGPTTSGSTPIGGGRGRAVASSTTTWRSRLAPWPTP